LQYASTGQEARAEEENAKMANSWLALKGDQENARQLRLEARLAELLRTTAAPCWAGAEHLSGYLMERRGGSLPGRGTEWLQRLASPSDHTTHCALPHPSAPPLCPPALAQFLSPTSSMQLKLPIKTVHAVGRLQDTMAIIHTVSSTSTAFCILHLPHSLGADDGLPIILVSQLFLEMIGGGCQPVAKLNPLWFILHIKSRGRSLICHCSWRCLLSLYFPF
jgi:hypothetical protein